MLHESLTWQLVLSFKKLFAGYKDSVVYHLVQSLVSFVQTSFNKSIIRNYVVSEHGLDKFYETSLFYRVLQAVVSFVARLIHGIFQFFVRIAKGGIVYRFISALCANKYCKLPYLCSAFFVVMLIVPHELWNNIYAVAGAFLLFTLALVAAFGKAVKKPTISIVPLSLIIFIVSIVCAVLISPTVLDSIRTSLFFFAAIVFMAVVWMTVDDENSLRVTIGALVSGLFIMCLYAIFQKITGVEVDPLLTDVSNNEGMPGRVYATVGNPNNFAEIIVMIVPFVYGLFFSTDSAKKKCILGAVLIACVMALAMSYSRSGYVAFAIATVVFVLIYDWRLIIPLLCLGVLCIPLIPQTVINRIFTIGSLEDTSNAYRIYLWEGARGMVKDYFVSGVGIGTEAFTSVYTGYAFSSAAKAPHSHMLYLELLIELGVVGIVSFMVYMLSSIRKGFSVVKKTNKTLLCTIAAAISAFCGISFTACVEYIWFYPRVMFVFWIVVGVLMAAIKLAKKHS